MCACLAALGCADVPRSPAASEANKIRRTDAPAPDRPLAAWEPYAPDFVYEGLTLEDWGIEWVRWSNAPTECVGSPVQDKDGSLCGRYQDPDSPVFILQLGVGRTTVRSECEIPAGKALLVPLYGVCLDKLGVWPDADTPDSELKRMIQDTMRSARDLVLVADGRAVQDLKLWSVGLTELEYTLPPEPNLYSCTGWKGITGRVSPAYLGGIFVLFPPPSPGVHTLEYGAKKTLDGDDIAHYVKTTFRVLP
ncbi:MAG TPA: hypothetical protein VJV78_29480 [Polyangiales bacterium]|nr:hypothetical protein [Polyangiales bacterium]